MFNKYPVFEKDDEEYVADTSLTLTSYPPKYNAYRLKDRKHTYVLCSDVQGKKMMLESDFKDFMYGKSNGYTYLPGGAGEGQSTPALSGPLCEPVVYPRPKTIDERIDSLEKQVKHLRRLVIKLTKE
jgi:hypothetical protein